MPITITKKAELKPKNVEQLTAPIVKAAPHDPAEMSEEQLADAYGSCKDQIDAIMNNPVFARFEIVKKELLKRIADQVPPEDGAEIMGDTWALEIGACSKNARKVKDIMMAQSFLGIEAFVKLAKINIGDLEKHLTPEQLEKVLTDDTGYGKSRDITVKYLGNKA